MAFRKRQVAVGRAKPDDNDNGQVQTITKNQLAPPGTRTSPLDGRLTTSSGAASLDSIVAHSGLPLDHSMLIEEVGTTNYAGVLTKYFAAEGLMQGHKVFVVGEGEHWGRELPGLVDVESKESSPSKGKDNEIDRMKIAWRYESLGDFGTSRRGVFMRSSNQLQCLRMRNQSLVADGLKHQEELPLVLRLAMLRLSCLRSAIRSISQSAWRCRKIILSRIFPRQRPPRCPPLKL
jgi:hypothetical protein